MDDTLPLVVEDTTPPNTPKRNTPKRSPTRLVDKIENLDDLITVTDDLKKLLWTAEMKKAELERQQQEKSDGITVEDDADGWEEKKVTQPDAHRKHITNSHSYKRDNGNGWEEKKVTQPEPSQNFINKERLSNDRFLFKDNSFNDNDVKKRAKITSSKQILDDEDDYYSSDDTSDIRSVTQGTNDILKDVKWRIPILTKKNYVLWKKNVDWALFVKGVEKYTQTRFDMPNRNHPDFKGFTTAYGLIANYIHHDVTNLIGEVPNNPYDVYHRIIELFNPKMAGTRLINRIKYFQLRCHDSSITKFCSNIEKMSAKIDSFSLFNDKMLRKMSEMSLVDTIKEVIKVIDEADKLAILLGGLNEAYQTEESLLRADPLMTYEKAKEVLEAAQFHMKSESGKDSVASATEKISA